MFGLLLSLGLAHAGGAAVILPSDAPVDLEAVKAFTAKTIARPGIEWLAASELGEAIAIRDAAAAHPGECDPPLDEAARSALLELQDTIGGELYVVLPRAKVRETQLWRYDGKKNLLMKVAGSARVAPVNAGSFTVMQIPWVGHPGPAIKDKRLAPLGEVTVTDYTDPGGLVEALMHHPNECTPPITPDQIAHFEELQTSVDDNLVLAVSVRSNKQPFLWRWDQEARLLKRMTI